MGIRGGRISVRHPGQLRTGIAEMSPVPVVEIFTLLGITQVVRANLLEELDSSQTLQSASAGNQQAISGSPSPQAPADLNSAEGLKSNQDVPVASGPFQPDLASRATGGCNNNGPVLNLAPGSYIQFKVAVPPGFLARMDDTPDGGKVITVISPEPPCPKCGVGRGIDGLSGSAINTIDNPAPTPQVAGSARGSVQNYQESAQMMQRSVQAGGLQQQNYPQQYSAPVPEQSVSSSQMYMKNSAYRKVQVQGANPLPYQARGSQNFPPQPLQPSFQRPVPQQPPPQPSMTQRLVRPSPQYQPMPSGQYQQPQYTQMNSAPEYQQPQQQQQSSQYVQQGSDANAYQQQPQFQPLPSSQQQPQFQPLPSSQQQPQFQPPAPSQQPGQPVGALEKFQTALRSLDDGAE